MIVQLQRDTFGNIISPKVYLCQPNREIIGELPVYGLSGDFKWNTYAEIQFSLDYQYVDTLTGEQKVHPLFDKAEGLRPVLLDGFGYYTIQDTDTVYSEQDSKTLTAFSLEYASAGTKYLESFYVNTGADESKEVIYHSNQNGIDYFNKDDAYKNATEWGAYTQYYIKSYNSDGSYAYEREQVNDEEAFNRIKDILFVKTYPSVQFYNPSVPELSLLNLVFKRIPEWTIGHVDRGLYTQIRKFEEQRISVYDFLMSKVADTFKCVVEWNSLDMTVNFYEEAEDGIEADNSVSTAWDSDIFISKENLATQIDVKMSSDNIKTKLKVSGGENSSISEVNLGQDYIINLNYYHTVDWMGQELYLRYHDYMQVVEEYATKYEEAAKSRQGAYNLAGDIEHSVPVDKGVLLVGDTFTQLYHTYDTEETLKQWLDIYGVKKDTRATKSDNVLLTLRDSNGNNAIIRVYYDEVAEKYQIKRTVENDSTGAEVPVYYDLSEWVGDKLDSKYMGMSDENDNPKYTIKSIGTLGAYLCLTVDESDPAELQDYGTRLLQEKKDVYTQIFVAQTQQAMSNEGAKCVAGPTEPTGEIADGSRWLDTSRSDMIILKEYQSSWKIVEIASTEQPTGIDLVDGVKWLDTNNPGKTLIYTYNAVTQEWIADSDDDETKSEEESDVVKAANYTMYLENFAKLTAVEQVLAEKEQLLKFYSDGVAIQGRYITKPTKRLMKDAVRQYFGSEPIDYPSSLEAYDENMLLYTFSITADNEHKYGVYLKNSVPYVAYLTSTGIWQLKMNYYKSVTNMETFFTEDEWMRLSPFIREDEFTDDNFALTGNESEEERADIGKQLLQNAQKELKTLSQPSLEFSMTMANILALPEFDSIKNQFKLGSFIRIGIRPDYVKRARLLEVHINFEDMSDFSANFGNLITTKSEIDKHADLLAQAIQAGKTVASSASSWQRAVNVSNNIDQAITEGLANATLLVGSASGQSIEIGQSGIWGRKLVDGTTNQYEDEQFRIINNKILFSDDAFKTSRALFGKFTYRDNDHFGVLADALVGGYVVGSTMEGGTIRIGEQPDGTYAFEVKSDGTVNMGGNSTIGGVAVNDIANASLNSEHAAVINNIKETFTWDSTGIQVAKKVTTDNGVTTPFYVHIDSGRMGFHSQTISNGIVNDTEVVHIGNNSATIQNAKFEGGNGTTFNTDMHINADANFNEAVNMYNSHNNGFAWQVEDDGSFSLIAIK